MSATEADRVTKVYFLCESDKKEAGEPIHFNSVALRTAKKFGRSECNTVKAGFIMI